MDRSMDEWIEGWESWGMNGWNRRTDGRSCTSITGTYVLFNDLYTHSFFLDLVLDYVHHTFFE